MCICENNRDVLRNYGNNFIKFLTSVSTVLSFSNFSNYKNRFTMPGDTEGIFYRYVKASGALPVFVYQPSFQCIKPAKIYYMYIVESFHVDSVCFLNLITGKNFHLSIYSWEKGWRNVAQAQLQTLCYMWVGPVGSLFSSERFFPWCSGFPLSPKTTMIIICYCCHFCCYSWFSLT